MSPVKRLLSNSAERFSWYTYGSGAPIQLRSVAVFRSQVTDRSGWTTVSTSSSLRTDAFSAPL